MYYMSSLPAHVMTIFNKDEPAHEVLRYQDSMAGFTHMVLNDLAKYKTGLQWYTEMSETERAEKFYGVCDTSKREKELANLREEIKHCNEEDKHKELVLLVLYSGLFDKYAPIFVDHTDTWYRESFLTRFTEKMMSKKVEDPTYHLIYELNCVSKEKEELKPVKESVNTYFLELLTEYNLLVEAGSFTPEEVTDEIVGFLNGYKGDYADGKMHTEFLKYVRSLKIGCFQKEE